MPDEGKNHPKLTAMLFEFIHPVMRKSLNLLFGIVLLVATAATLSCRVAILGGTHIPPLPNDELLLLPNPLNSTLLHFAAIDIGELKARQEIQHLLEPNFAQPRQRSISSWRIENHLDPLHAQPQLRLTANTGIPFALRSPKYNGKWFQFRKNLAAWFRNKHFQSQIIFHLLDLVKRPLDRHYRFAPTSDHRYASCAVVGNSGILLNNQYGDLIDAHQIVIRLNNARTKGYHHNVGSKTSISFINSNILHLCARREGCFCHPYGETVPMLMYMCQPAHFMDYTICNSSHKAPLLITDARFDVLCARIVKYYSLKRFVEETGKSPEEWASTHDGSMFHYSSGMQAVVLALGTCDRVSLFGFGKSSAAKHHYHTNQKAELHLHDYEAEYAFYRDLVSGDKAIPFLPENFKIPPVVVYQ